MNDQQGFPSQGAGETGRRAASLVEVFRRRATANAQDIAFTFLGGGDLAAAHDLTYAELDRQARALAAHLQRVASPGERAVLVYDAGLDYIVALAGCLYAGIIAVPVFPPDPLRATRTLPRLEAIVNDAQATLLLGTSSDLGWTSAMLGQIPSLRTLVPHESIDPRLANEWVAPALDRDMPAFIQYTSGSTGTPRGVVIRHGNALANLAQMEERIDVPNALVCTWLPAYHDMGLVGGILQCWYSGRRNCMLPPLGFFQRPLRWLQAIAAYRATTIAAPDFAYDLCVRKTTAAERQGLDLSSLVLALSGAEPVRAATIDRFVEAFAGCGVRREIFFPCYGMAEATLLISSPAIGFGLTVRTFDGDRLTQNEAIQTAPHSPTARTLVGCGQSPPDQHLLVVDPQSRRPLGPRQVGEIWVSGPNVAREYWGRPTESQATFHACDATGVGPFLRTGDLGFVDGGELFISGRLKDLIILRGRNYHPQDIEQTLEACHAALRPRGGAAFSIDEGGRERLVIVHEVTRPKKVDLEEVCRAIRQTILEVHDLIVDRIVLVRSGSMPKTTSGKIQRHACREQFLRDEFDDLHAWRLPSTEVTPESYVAPRNDVESALAEAWAEVLGVSRVGIFDCFFELGGSSLQATQLISRLAPQFAVEIPLSELFDRPTVAALADLISTRQAAKWADDAALLARLESLSDAEAAALLAANQVLPAAPPVASRADGNGPLPARYDGNSPVLHTQANGKFVVLGPNDARTPDARAPQH